MCDDKHLSLLCFWIQGNQNSYYFSFLACEILNLIVVVINFVVTDDFLNGNFKNYGSEVWNELVNGDDTFNVMCNAFPTRVSLLFTPGLEIESK